MTRRRWMLSGLVVVLVVALGLGTVAFQFGLPWQMQDGDRNHVYTLD